MTGLHTCKRSFIFHKGKISAKRVERIMSNVGSESKDRRNYHLETVDSTIWSGGDLEPGDT